MPAYKDTTTNKWYVSFYYTNWKNERKKKKKMGFKLKQEALDWEREFLQTSAGSPDMSFTSLVEIYMQDMSSRLKRNTILNKENIINTKILPYFGKFPISSIKASHIRKWQSDLINEGYKPTYLKTINNQLSAIFNYAVQFYSLDQNPCRIAGSMGKKNADEMNFWTIDDYNLAIQEVKKKRERIVIELMFWSGIRVGELLALKPIDFDFNTFMLTIDESYQRLEGEDVITDTKTLKSDRVISIPDFVCYNVKEYMDKLYGLKEHDRIFETTKSTIGNILKQVSKKADVPQIRVHDLRHSHAALLIENNENILAVSQRLGHKNVETTLNTYGHLYPNTQDAMRERMENLNRGTI